MRRIFVVLAVVAAACGGAAQPSDTPSASAAVTSTLPRVTQPATVVESTTCTSAPPRAWAIMCQAVGLIDEVYVDEVARAELVAAATLGIRSVPPTEQAEPPGDVFRCMIPDDEFLPVCEAVLDRLKRDHDDPELLVRGALNGIFQYALDPFSSYVPPDYADQLDEFGSGAVYDLGMSVSARSSSGEPCSVISASCRLEVVSVFPITPAASEGVVVGDFIVAVDGEILDGLSAEAATALLFGPAGVSVELRIERDTGSVTKSLVREDFRFDPIEYEMLTASVAYLRLNTFSQLSAQLVGQVLGLPEVGSARAMILDLRDNPGGLVLAAQAIASQFLDGDLVMVERGRDYEYPWEVIEGGLANPSMQLIVLVNRASASASEVLAAVLKERGRATVVGEPTFGKNLVQQVYSARDGGQLRITVARWETPGGRDIGITGLEPDIVVVPDFVDGTDPILEEAYRILGI
jgi:carboxyl-terminal processing protease